MGESSFLAQRQSNCEWSREADHSEHDIALREIAAQWAVLHGASNDRLHECAGSAAKIGPVTFFQEWMDHVDHTNSIIESHMHVLAERVDSVRYGFNKSLSGTDALFQYVSGNSVKKRLLVREVSVEGSNADAGAFCDGVARGFAANFQNQFNCDFDESLSILLCISAHRRGVFILDISHKRSIFLRLRLSSF